MVGDNFLVRGYEDGRHFMTREKFYPTLFVKSNKESKYKTLEAQSLVDDFAGNHQLLDFTGPLPDGAQLAVPIEFLCGEILGVSVPAQYLNTFCGYADARF